MNKPNSIFLIADWFCLVNEFVVVLSVLVLEAILLRLSDPGHIPIYYERLYIDMYLTVYFKNN
jgi:hypothetical protein